MPGLAGGGLPDAEQIITADASGYLRALDEIIRKNDSWINKTREMQREAEKWQKAVSDFGRNMPETKVDVKTDEGFDRRIREMQRVVSTLADTALAANRKMAEAWDTHTESVHEVASSYEHAGDALGDFRQHVQDGGSQVRSLSQDMAELGRNAERTAAAIDRVKASGWTPEALAAAARANAAQSSGAAGPPVRYYGGLGGDPMEAQARALQALAASRIIPEAMKDWLARQAYGYPLARQDQAAAGQDFMKIARDAWMQQMRQAGGAGPAGAFDSGGGGGFPAVSFDATNSIVRAVSSPAVASAIVQNVAGPATSAILGQNLANAVQAGINARKIQQNNLPGGIWPAVAQGGGFGVVPAGGATGGAGGPGVIWPVHPGGIAGGGGGGGGGFFGGLASGGAFDLGRAASDSLRVGNFIKQWYGVAHWVMMLSNELLATVGPAVVAAGMGGLVGMQGAEQAIPRGRAIFATAESLGPSLGITAGQAFGLKNAPLQTAQDLATGAAFGLTGAVINSLKAGAGNAFVQLGSNTVAMFSRFAATMTQEFQHGLGKQLGNIVAGGTGYLQQLGDVLGNIGHIFMNVAPNLPGVGGDLLSTLQGATGGLAAITHWAGTALGPVLSFEAGARWGPPILGGVARGLSRFTGGRLGAVAREATKADIGKVFNPATNALVAKEGETIAGTGLAGAMGGMGAIDLGAIAASAYLIGKGATYQTPAQQQAAATMQAISQMGMAQGVPPIIAAMQAAAKVPAGTAGALSPLQESLQGFGKLGAGIGRGRASEATQGLIEAIGAGVGTIGGLLGFKTGTPSNYSVAQQQLQQLSDTMVNALGSGQRVANVWKGLTGQTLSMGKAFDVATMAQLQLGTAFEKNGKLTSQAKTMIANLQTGYQAMNFTGGQFGGAVGAQTAMAGLQHTQLAAVNQAYDQLSQIIQGGASGAATFFGLLGGTPVTTTRGGIRFPAVSKSDRQFAASLGSFTSSAGAAAWNALTNQQTGLFPALENQMGWLRTAQTMNALTPGQTTSMAGFEIAQAMSKVGNNPTALSMLSYYAQQFGGPGFAPGTSGKTMRADLSKWIAQSGLTSSSFNKLMSLGSQGMTNIGTDAQQFVQQIGSGVAGGLAQGITTRGADLQNRFLDSILQSGGKTASAGALGNYATYLANTGVPLKAAMEMAQYGAKISGAGSNAGIQQAITSAIDKAYNVKITADTSSIQSALGKLQNKVVTAQVKAQGTSEVKTLQASIDALKSKTVQAAARAEGAAAVRALNAEIAALHDKIVTILVRTINQTITQIIGGGTAPGGIAPATFAGTGAPNMRITRGQTGMKIPGYGGGDIVPAMLEPGELVVPKHMVAAGLVGHLAGKIPGFQTGGFVGQSTYGSGAYWGAGSQMALWNPALLAALLAAMRASQGTGVFDHPQGFRGLIPGGGGGAGGSGSLTALAQAAAQAALQAVATASKGGAGQQFAIQVIQGLTGHIKNLKGETSTLAKELVNKLEQEVKYATGVAQAAAYGQGYDPSGRGSGIFGSMNLASASGLTQAQLHSSPTGNIKDYNAYVAAYAAGTVGGPGPQSVQDQMKSYLGTLKSFGSDITKLRKEHLNKDVMAQIIAAGPQQGDQIAQSIMGGQGGVGAVNKLWQQIQKASKGLGAQAAMAQYGGHLSSDLRHGQVSIGGVTINVSVGGGKGGTLDLTPSQIAQIVAAVQAALLRQSKKNNKGGVKLPGKGT